MGRPRDTFWNYAHPESDKRFKCNFCDKVFAGGISRIKSHLSGIKGRDIHICLKVPDHIRAEARQAIDDSLPCEKKGKMTIESPPCKKKGKRIISISDDDDDETVFVGTTAEQHAIGSSPSNNKGGKSVVVEAPNDDEIVVDEDEPNSARLLLTASCTSRESRKKELDKLFLKCYEIMDGVSKEDSQLLVQLVKGVSDFGPTYELPNLVTAEEQILEYERGVKESWRETGFTLMFVPGWNGGYYANVFAYCPKGMLLLTSGDFSAARTAVAGVIAEFGERHCLQVIALDDRSRISLQLVQMMKDNYVGVLTSRSPIKVIHNLVLNVMSYHGGISHLLDAIEIIFTYMWKCSLVWRRKIFNEWKKHTPLKCTYPESFSDQLMLLRPVIEHEAEVVSTVQSMDISKWVSGVVTSKTFWTIGKEVIHSIDILFPLARLVQGTVPAFGYFYEAVNKACNALDEFCDKDPILYSKLKSWGWDETLWGMIMPIHAAACLLNPAIMCGENFKEESQMIKGIYELMENFFVDQADRDLFLSQVEPYRAKCPSIFTDTACRKSKTLHPWAWWREFGGRVPELQKCAIQILSQPCDVPLWTRDLPAANNASERRKLKLSLMEKFSGSEASSLEPIDLETAVEPCESEEREYFDDLSTSSNPAATLGLKRPCLLDPEEIDFSKYQEFNDFFLATTEYVARTKC